METIEVRFRQTRTNMENPELSPPFSTYQSAWREAFVDTFALLDMKGNADEAAQMSVDGWRRESHSRTRSRFWSM